MYTNSCRPQDVLVLLWWKLCHFIFCTY